MKQKKRIAVIGLKGLPALGGAAVVGENIIRELADDYDFTVYAVSSHADKNEVAGAYRQIIFRRVQMKSANTFLYFVRSALHVLVRKKYDLIHLHHASSGFITPFLRLRYKVVVTFHGINRIHASDPKFARLLNKLIAFSQQLNLRFASHIVSVSKPDADYLNALGKRKVQYIPNGVFTAAETVPSPVPSPYLIFAANRVYDIKGLHLVLEAMHLNEDKRLLIVIGDLSHKQSYKEKILLLAEGLNVVFTGLIKDKKQLFGYISKAEIFLFPSLTEAMSMMLLEVAALGVPLIASDIEANMAVFDRKEAVFFESGNPVSLAEKLRETTPEVLERLAINALERVHSFHQWPVVAAAYQEVFDTLSGKRTKRNS